MDPVLAVRESSEFDQVLDLPRVCVLKPDDEGVSGDRRLPDKRYKFEKTLWDTAFGGVYLALDTTDQHKVVIKRSRCSRQAVSVIDGKSPSAENPLREVQMLSRLQHPGIVRLLRAYVVPSRRECYAVLEHAEHGELLNCLLHSKHPCVEAMAQHFFRQVATAVHFLHSRDIVHLDLSLENLLLFEDAVVKLCDFGQAVQLPTSTTTSTTTTASSLSSSETSGGKMDSQLLTSLVGKAQYAPPEVLDASETHRAFDGRACDMFALGVILFTLLMAVPPFKRASCQDACFAFLIKYGVRELIHKWRRQTLISTPPLSSQVLDLLQGLLCVDPIKRLTSAQLLAHPWLVSPDKQG